MEIYVLDFGERRCPNDEEVQKERVTRGKKDLGRKKKRDPGTVSLDERKIPEGQTGERENRNEN